MHLNTLAHKVHLLQRSTYIARSESSFCIVKKQLGISPNGIVLIATFFLFVRVCDLWIKKFTHVVSCTTVAIIAPCAILCYATLCYLFSTSVNHIMHFHYTITECCAIVKYISIETIVAIAIRILRIIGSAIAHSILVYVVLRGAISALCTCKSRRHSYLIKRMGSLAY